MFASPQVISSAKHVLVAGTFDVDNDDSPHLTQVPEPDPGDTLRLPVGDLLELDHYRFLD